MSLSLLSQLSGLFACGVTVAVTSVVFVAAATTYVTPGQTADLDDSCQHRSRESVRSGSGVLVVVPSCDWWLGRMTDTSEKNWGNGSLVPTCAVQRSVLPPYQDMYAVIVAETPRVHPETSLVVNWRVLNVLCDLNQSIAIQMKLNPIQTETFSLSWCSLLINKYWINK